MDRSKRGFTLPELLATLCVVSLFLGVGLPSMRAILDDSEVAAMASGYLGAFNAARFRAVSEHRRIAVCAPGEHRDCSGNWAGKLQVFYDDDADGVLSSEADLLETVTLPDPQRLSVTFRAFARSNYVALRPEGYYRQNGTFRFCPRQGGRGRAIVINVAGRARTERIQCLPA